MQVTVADDISKQSCRFAGIIKALHLTGKPIWQKQKPRPATAWYLSAKLLALLKSIVAATDHEAHCIWPHKTMRKDTCLTVVHEQPPSASSAKVSLASFSMVLGPPDAMHFMNCGSQDNIAYRLLKLCRKGSGFCLSWCIPPPDLSACGKSPIGFAEAPGVCSLPQS